MPRFLLMPRWIVAHLIIVAVAISSVMLGLWQLDRLSEVKAENATIAARFDAEPTPLLDLVSTTAGGPESEYVRVTVTGTYAPEDEVLQRTRARNGVNGFHVLTPLVFSETSIPDTQDATVGGAVLVRRGWVPFELDTPPVAPAAPPEGEVTVTGYLERSEPQPEGFGQRDPDEGVLERVFRADVSRIDQQVAARLLPGVILHLEEQSPPQSGPLPYPADRPDLSEANHLSYALQWFSFALIALIGYPIVLRKRIQESRETDAVPEDDAEVGVS